MTAKVDENQCARDISNAGATFKHGLEWHISTKVIPYPEAIALMEQRVAAIHQETATEMVWLLEHPPLYTAGTSAQDSDLLQPSPFPVYQTGRGGQYTYHGPGQRIAYVMMNLKQRSPGTPDIHAYVRNLEEWLIRTLAPFGVKGERRPGRVGIWVNLQPYGGQAGEEAKIAAIGVRVRHGITFHGVSLNVNPDLNHFSGIVPCGLREYGVTSMQALGHTVSMAEIDKALHKAWNEVFEDEFNL